MGEASMLALDDGDGFCEVHVNIMEGFWSLLVLGCDPTEAFPKKSYPFL
jgi:hypothetical protein